MSDPYNHYPPYSTTTAPDGVGYYYYPPENQYQPPYGQENSHEQSYSPYRQYGRKQAPTTYSPVPPDNFGPPPPQQSSTLLSPAAGAGQYENGSLGPYSYQNDYRRGSNLEYYGQQPLHDERYVPKDDQKPPHRSRSPRSKKWKYTESGSHSASEGERDFGGTLLGGSAGHYFGHRKNHGLLGTIGGAILGNIIGDRVKEHDRHHNSGHHRPHRHHHHHHHHHHHQGHHHHSHSHGDGNEHGHRHRHRRHHHRHHHGSHSDYSSHGGGSW